MAAEALSQVHALQLSRLPSTRRCRLPCVTPNTTATRSSHAPMAPEPPHVAPPLSHPRAFCRACLPPTPHPCTPLGPLCRTCAPQLGPPALVVPLPLCPPRYLPHTPHLSRAPPLPTLLAASVALVATAICAALAGGHAASVKKPSYRFGPWWAERKKSKAIYFT